VLSGSATGGDRHRRAHLFRHPGGAGPAVERAPTAFQAGVNKVSWLLIRFMAVMTPWSS
jgi:Mg2+-importing ATPase